jgi:hypothetical protein
MRFASLLQFIVRLIIYTRIEAPSAETSLSIFLSYIRFAPHDGRDRCRIAMMRSSWSQA